MSTTDRPTVKPRLRQEGGCGVVSGRADRTGATRSCAERMTICLCKAAVGGRKKPCRNYKVLFQLR
jgi:hypothetical protein